MQFFLRQDDVGKSRAEACVSRLAELNAYVPVRDLGGSSRQPISIDHVKNFQVRLRDLISFIILLIYSKVVVLVNQSLEKQLEINDWTHANGVHFIAAETHGLFSYAVATIFSATKLRLKPSAPSSMILGTSLHA